MRSKEVHVGIKHESIFLLLLLLFFCFSFLFPFKRFPVDVYLFLVVKPLIKGIPRYNEGIPRRTYSDMFRITNPCHKHIFQADPRYSVYLDSNACMIPIADGIMLRLK